MVCWPEIPVARQEVAAVLGREDCEEAVDRRTDGHAATAERPVEVRGRKVRADSGRFEKRHLAKESLEFLPFPLDPLEDLGDDEPARRDVVLTRQKLVHQLRFGRAAAVQELDPC